MTTALLATFVVSLVASVVLGSVMRRMAAAIGAVVPPRPDRWHSEPTPTMGGVAILAAMLIAMGVAFVLARGPEGTISFDAPWLPVMLSSLAMFVVGVVDDSRARS